MASIYQGQNPTVVITVDSTAIDVSDNVVVTMWYKKTEERVKKWENPTMDIPVGQTLMWIYLPLTEQETRSFAAGDYIISTKLKHNGTVYFVKELNLSVTKRMDKEEIVW